VTDWTELPLSAAVILQDDTNDLPWGQYLDGHIVTLDGFPDFYYPDLRLDRTTTVSFEFTYDPADPHEDGGRFCEIWAASDTDFDASYQSPYVAFDHVLAVSFSQGPDDDPNVVILTIAPAAWAGVPDDFNTPLLETDFGGALSRLRYTGDAITPTFPTSFLTSRTAFAS
jgi:hypothetical protein